MWQKLEEIARFLGDLREGSATNKGYKKAPGKKNASETRIQISILTPQYFYFVIEIILTCCKL